MWNLASTATKGSFASQVHPLSLTMVVGKMCIVPLGVRSEKTKSLGSQLQNRMIDQ